MIITTSKYIFSAVKEFFSPRLKEEYKQDFYEDLYKVNLDRVKIFSFTLAFLNSVFSIVLDSYFYLSGKVYEHNYLEKLFILHLATSITFFFVFIVSNYYLKKNTNIRFISVVGVWSFSLITIALTISASLIEQMLGGIASVYLIGICIILIFFHWKLKEAFWITLAGNISYLTVVFLTRFDELMFINQVIYTFMFSFIFFLVSRNQFKIKAQEFENFKETISQASILKDKNEQILQAENTLTSINKNIRQGLFRIDRHGKLRYVNQFLANLFGFEDPKEMMENWNIKLLFQLQEFREIKSALLRHGSVKNKQLSYNTSKGEKKWMILNCNIHHSNHEVFYDGSLVDNSEIIKNQELLENLSLVASKTDNAVYIIDKEEKIEWINEGFTRITGYTAHDAVGKKPGILFQGENIDPETVQKMGERILKGKGFTGEMLNYRKDGSEFWVHMALNPILNENGHIEKYVVVQSDITERKNVEKELREAKERAEELVKVKDDFLSMVSHELRTPLNGVIGMSHLLLEENPRKDQRSNLQSLKNSAEYLLSLINDILDFSKIEAGKISIVNAQFNFPEFIGSIEQTFMIQAKEKKIQFNVQFDEEIPNCLIGDSVRLNQVIFNLLSNSFKFTDKGFVELTVKIRKIYSDKVALTFIVKDTGIGIPQDKLKAIFDRFEQVPDSSEKKRGGTGLGLAITKNLVELMDGKISVKSTLGLGSEFACDLVMPIGNNELEITAQHQEEEAPFENLKLLLVEDNKINQMVAIKFIKKWNIEYEVAENGFEALALVKNNQFDIILMDLQMPKMNGYEATKKIRLLNSYYQNIPIIALTAASLEVKDKAYQSGMNDFLIKPFNPSELFRKIKKYQKIDHSNHRLPENQTFDISEIKKIANHDMNFLTELLQICSEQFNSFPGQLKGILHKKNYEEARNLMHKVKPSIKMLNYFQLEKAAVEFNAALQHNPIDIQKIHEVAAELIKVIKEVSTLIDKEMKSIESLI